MEEVIGQNPAFIADTIYRTVGLADIMSFWTFDNVYEELGVPRNFMSNNYGLLGTRGVPRPSYHAFTLLHKLGDVELKSDSDKMLATRRKDGSVAVPRPHQPDPCAGIKPAEIQIDECMREPLDWRPATRRCEGRLHGHQALSRRFTASIVANDFR